MENTLNMPRQGFLKGMVATLVCGYNTEAGPNSKIILPGRGKVGLYDSIIEGGHFNWAEATKGGTRIPEEAFYVGNIVKMAHDMEVIREMFGNKGITVTSWYRDPVSNRRVGGARNSQHMQGHAVDFFVDGVRPIDVYEELNGVWGDKGGLGKYSGFTHVDRRGTKARWGNA